jgi:parallel beta-helix repeat protein
MKILRRTLTATAALLAALAATPAALADTDRVRPGESIQAAIDAAEPGDTIRVDAGVFRENLTITTNRLRLVGAGHVGPGPRTFLRPAATPAASPCTVEEEGETFVAGICAAGEFDPVTFEPGAPLVGTRIQGFLVEGFGDGVLFFNANDSRVKSVHARNNDAYGITGFIVHGIRFVHNAVHDNGEAGLYVGDSSDADAVVRGNSSSGNLEGIFLRDSSNGLVEDNRIHDNCAGIVVLETGAPDPSGNWDLLGNVAKRNNEACPGGDEQPPISGVGIALAGTDEVIVEENTVIDNRPSIEAPFAGGVVVFATSEFGGDEPNGNRVRRNFIRRNEPADIVWDGTGTDNRFRANDCRSSIPGSLC